MISKDKEYTTRSGLPVRIYATDGGGDMSVHGATLEDGEWISDTWDEDGFYESRRATGQRDLIEKPKTRKLDVWVNVYPSGSWTSHYSRAEADGWDRSALATKRIACLPITREFVEGEGLTP